MEISWKSCSYSNVVKLHDGLRDIGSLPVSLRYLIHRLIEAMGHLNSAAITGVISAQRHSSTVNIDESLFQADYHVDPKPSQLRTLA